MSVPGIWQIEKSFGQKRPGVRGEEFDTFCPLGPVLVTKDEIRKPNNLASAPC